NTQFKQALSSLYERKGRVNDALGLLRASSTSASSGAPSCMPGFVPHPMSPSVATAVDVIRLMIRANHANDAAAETAKLVARAGDPNIGVQAYTLAAQLYAEQQKFDLAAQTLATGAKAVHERDDQRAIEVARADLLVRSNRTAE